MVQLLSAEQLPRDGSLTEKKYGLNGLNESNGKGEVI
jgi:hypothetical protein